MSSSTSNNQPREGRSLTTTTTGSSSSSSSISRRLLVAFGLVLIPFSIHQNVSLTRLLTKHEQEKATIIIPDGFSAPVPPLLTTAADDNNSTVVRNVATKTTTTSSSSSASNGYKNKRSSSRKTYSQLSQTIQKQQQRRQEFLTKKEAERKGQQRPQKKKREPPIHSLSAYTRAQVFNTTTNNWFTKRKQCKETCCVETVAISLDQDKYKIINTGDGKDLADLRLEGHDRRRIHSHLHYHASTLREEILPCLLPGTIIFVEHIEKAIKYFWNTIRPKIKVPFVLILSGSDNTTPGWSADYMSDPLLMKLYGTNPWIMHNLKQKQQHIDQKYQSMPLGLSRIHSQEPYLSQYLQLTNYQNPFKNLQQKWMDAVKAGLDFDRDVFVHFGVRLPKRQQLWDILCPIPNSNVSVTASCDKETTKLSIHDIYKSMSQYKFGISPPGNGWDCYRTYEMLLLGVIPIVDIYNKGEQQLMKGLPVIPLKDMYGEIESKQDVVDVIQNYITTASDAFVVQNQNQNNNTFFQEAWDRLFLKYTRDQILKDTGRDIDLLVDDNGKRYYQAFHYTSTIPNREDDQEIYCARKGNCEIPGNGGKVDSTWLQQQQNKQPSTLLNQQEKKWLEDWELAAK